MYQIDKDTRYKLRDIIDDNVLNIYKQKVSDKKDRLKEKLDNMKQYEEAEKQRLISLGQSSIEEMRQETQRIQSINDKVASQSEIDAVTIREDYYNDMIANNEFESKLRINVSNALYDLTKAYRNKKKNMQDYLDQQIKWREALENRIDELKVDIDTMKDKWNADRVLDKIKKIKVETYPFNYKKLDNKEAVDPLIDALIVMHEAKKEELGIE